ncbi:MAG TPA: hypothetical protein VMT18_12660 [Planctomycetota bacterium]|nr:hypothetical protein [Planctomycetota bacterium]
MPLAALLILALASAPVQRAQGPSARVEVLEGRAILAGAGVVVRIEAGDPERWIDGAAHLELAADSRARVTWSGRASLVLEGRNVLAWRPAAGGAAPAWDLAEVGAAHLELRRGPLDVTLAGGWGARLQSGACALRGLPGDAVELDHQAGLPLDLWPPQHGQAPSVPFTVLAGARLRLVSGAGRPLALQGSQANLRDPHQRLGFERERTGRQFPAWRGFAWPWSSSVPLLSIAATAVERAQPELPDRPVQPLPADAAEAQDAVTAPQDAVTAPLSETPGQAADERALPDDRLQAPARALREHGVLVLTPYGPRWLDASRSVDPALRRMQAARGRN